MGDVKKFPEHGIPILGRPQVLDGRILLLVRCPCEAKTPMMIDRLGPGGTRVCPACRGTVAVMGITWSHDKPPNFEMQVGVAKPATPKEEEPRG